MQRRVLARRGETASISQTFIGRTHGLNGRTPNSIRALHDDFIRAVRRGPTRDESTVALIMVVTPLATATGNLPECYSMTWTMMIASALPRAEPPVAASVLLVGTFVGLGMAIPFSGIS